MNAPTSDIGGSGSRIAVDLRALVGEPSGIGFYTLSMLRELVRLGNSYVGMAHRDVVAAEELVGLGMELEAHAAPLGVLWQQLRLPRRLHRADLDLLWSPITTLPVRLPVPAVVTIHDLTPLLFPEAHRLKVRWSVLPFLGSTVRSARRIAVDSKATALDLRERFRGCEERVRVVYPGVDADFRPAEASRIAQIRSDLGLPEGYILYAGTIEPRKNLNLLLDAWQGLASDDATMLPLVIAGPYGWHSGHLMRRIDALRPRGVRYTGRIPRHQLVELMQAATLFVYPSLYEGFGLPPLEAMACGTPTIVSNRSSLPEVVGDAGVQIDPANAAQLAAAVRRILDNTSLSLELRERGLERARAFAWSRAAAAMQELFRESLC